MNEALHQAMAEIAGFLAAHPAVGNWYTAIVRFLFPVLAILILLRAVRSLLRLPTTPETWAQLSLPNGAPIPLTHWENILGRGGSADVRLNFPSVSRQHAAICRDTGSSESRVKSMLYHTRRKLREHLEREGIEL